MTGGRIVAVSLLLVIAGCGSPLATPTPDTIDPTVQPADPTSSLTPYPTGTAEDDSARNPWRTDEVVVGIDSSVSPNWSFVRIVERAVGYWNGPGRPNASYPVTFRVEPGAESPDILVSVRNRVNCADREDVLGCAPQLSATDRPPQPVRVEIAAGFSNETTLRVLKHEFGHVLGIAHGQPPLPLMEARHVASTLPRTDAVNKSNPWTTTDIVVSADYAGVTDDVDTHRFQLGQAVNYYDTGAEGHVPSNVSFTLTENRSQAQIEVVFNQDLQDCSTDEAQSCGFRQGFDPDGDGALEYYTNATIVLNGIDPKAVGWHVGYWLGILMGHDQPEELAPAFQNTSYDDRRSAWWE